MRRFSLIALALLLCLGLAACGADDPAENDGNQNNDNYESCHAYPTCDADDQEVEECPDGATCYERSECDHTILCEAAACDLPDSCPEGFDEVGACQSGDCVEITTCDDEELFCEPGDEHCEENPTCPAGYEPVDECAIGADCFAVDGCDEILICQDTATCPGIPVCDGDDPEVDTCPEDATCYEVEECQVEITCMSEGPLVCEEYGCPEGYDVITPCGADDECMLISGCSDDLTCGGAAAPDPCTTEPTCPEGWAAFDNCEDAFDVCALSSLCNELIECAPQDLVDDYEDPCDTTCPDGFSAVADYDACYEGVDTDDGDVCLYTDVCGDQVFCRADNLLDCQSSYEICPDGYSSTDSDCSAAGDNTCYFGMGCDDLTWCDLD
jgi:hypothetical protein